MGKVSWPIDFGHLRSPQVAYRPSSNDNRIEPVTQVGWRFERVVSSVNTDQTGTPRANAGGITWRWTAKQLQSALLAGAACIALVLGDGIPALANFPHEWVVPAGKILGQMLTFLMDDVAIGGAKLSEITRSVASILAMPVNWTTSLLTEGLFIPLAHGGEVAIPPLPWFATAVLLVLLAYRLAGRWPAVLTAAALVYSILFGLWPSTIITLVSVVFAVAVASTLGVALGVWGHRSRAAARVLEPIYDALQTVPTFSYLSLILLLFGFGPIAALIATVIFAMPPMARATTLGLSQVPPDIRDLATMSGCTSRQRLWQVELPSRRTELLVGLNQVIMLSLAMVIIASVIGAGGLGGDVLRNLKALRMTQALEAGLAITFLAIALDKVSSTLTIEDISISLTCRRAILTLAVATLLTAILVALAAPGFGKLPERPMIDLGRSLDLGLDHFNQWARTPIVAIRDGTIVWLLRPLREAFAVLPWLATALGVAAAGALISGRMLAATCGGLLIAIAALGLWDKAMLSLYLVMVSIIVALIIGFPAGVWAGLQPRVFRVVIAVADTIQTLPNFVYLIPVVMFFGVGDFPAFLSIVIYAIAPVIRYTAIGIQQVPLQLSEAAVISGCTPMQRLLHVLLPVSMPQLLLGLNQAIMLAFSMLVITSLVGSRGLEEATLVAVAKVRPGDGLVAGFGIAALAIIVDRLLRGASGHLAVRFGAAKAEA